MSRAHSAISSARSRDEAEPGVDRALLFLEAVGFRTPAAQLGQQPDAQKARYRRGVDLHPPMQALDQAAPLGERKDALGERGRKERAQLLDAGLEELGHRE